MTNFITKKDFENLIIEKKIVFSPESLEFTRGGVMLPITKYHLGAMGLKMKIITDTQEVIDPCEYVLLQLSNDTHSLPVVNLDPPEVKINPAIKDNMGEDEKFIFQHFTDLFGRRGAVEFLQYLADALQKPKTRLPYLPYVVGRQGNGKSSIIKLIYRMFDRSVWQFNSFDELCNYNSSLMGKKWAIMDDGRMPRGSEEEKQSKSLIGNEIAQYRDKYFKSKSTLNYHRYLIVGNDRNIPSFDASRRMRVFYTTDKLPSPQKMNKYHNLLENKNAIENIKNIIGNLNIDIDFNVQSEESRKHNNIRNVKTEKMTKWLYQAIKREMREIDYTLHTFTFTRTDAEEGVREMTNNKQLNYNPSEFAYLSDYFFCDVKRNPRINEYVYTINVEKFMEDYDSFVELEEEEFDFDIVDYLMNNVRWSDNKNTEPPRTKLGEKEIEDDNENSTDEDKMEPSDEVEISSAKDFDISFINVILEKIDIEKNKTKVDKTVTTRTRVIKDGGGEYFDTVNIYPAQSDAVEDTTEYETVNETLTPDGNNRDVNCKMNRFLFEMDEGTQEEQFNIINSAKKKGLPINRITHSGNKSLHVIVELDEESTPEEKDEYQFLWKYLNASYFDGKCDGACKNNGRLTRHPNGINLKTGNVQKLIENFGIRTTLNWRPYYTVFKNEKDDILKKINKINEKKFSAADYDGVKELQNKALIDKDIKVVLDCNGYESGKRDYLKAHFVGLCKSLNISNQQIENYIIAWLGDIDGENHIDNLLN